MGDVFPRRNLGNAEYWGRTVERRIEDSYRRAGVGDLLRAGTNRSNASSAEELAKNIDRLTNQIAQTQALLDATPATASAGVYTDNFSLEPGWQTVLVTAIPAFEGRPILDVFCNAVVRIVDPGGGSGPGPTPGGAFSWPFDPRPISQGGTVTSEYGPRDGRMHEGIDFGVSEGTPIPAANDGTVLGVGYGSGTGNYVDLSHSGGIVTRYFHMVVLSDFLTVGQSVTKGQNIGRVGNTGNSFGAHLHWETIVNGIHWNPRDFMSIYGDGSSSTPPPSGTPSDSGYSNPRARIFLNGNPSFEFSPHRDVGGAGGVTLNQLFPLQQIYNFPSQTGQADAELQVFSQTSVPANAGNFARMTLESISRPPL